MTGELNIMPAGAIPPGELEHRRVYLVRSRNLVVGVWNAASRGFIGIREKFHRRYLFTEYGWWTSTVTGTAWATERTDIVIPPEVELVESFYLAEPYPRRKANQALYDLLEPLDAAENAKWMAEWRSRSEGTPKDEKGA